MNIDARIDTLARALKTEGVMTISFADWRAFCIMYRIGYDVRTQKSVLALAETVGMVKRKPKVPTLLYDVDQKRITQILKLGDSDGN